MVRGRNFKKAASCHRSSIACTRPGMLTYETGSFERSANKLGQNGTHRFTHNDRPRSSLVSKDSCSLPTSGKRKTSRDDVYLCASAKVVHARDPTFNGACPQEKSPTGTCTNQKTGSSVSGILLFFHIIYSCILTRLLYLLSSRANAECIRLGVVFLSCRR